MWNIGHENAAAAIVQIMRRLFCKSKLSLFGKPPSTTPMNPHRQRDINGPRLAHEIGDVLIKIIIFAMPTK